jgi:hypothetical protein
MRKKTSPQLQLAIRNANHLHDFVRDSIGKLETLDLKTHTLLGFCNIALEHQNSIVYLVDLGGHDSSALALFRCLVEAMYRGLWTQVIATNVEVDAIRSGRHKFGGIIPMVESVAEKIGLAGALTIPRPMLDLLHSFTHAGIEQLIKQYEPGGTIQPNHTPEEMVTVVALSANELDTMGGIACSLCGRNESAVQIHRLYTELFPIDEA